MSAGNDVPLNTTEHILRRVEAILEEVRKENNEFKWDFPSFVVTLVIGLIAAAFAGLTIVQALLATGTGRLKSGKYAIGPWSELTRRSFGGELRVRTTTETPVITFESAKLGAMVVEMLEDDDFGQLRQSEVQEQDSHEQSFVARPWALATQRWKGKRRRMSDMSDMSDIVDTVSRKVPQDHFPATWLSLLTILNLDDPSLWARKRVAADYIPSDLPAVPAHGRVRDITHLALIASKGKAKLDFGTDVGHRLPLIRGNTMGLNFRDHPLLGLVGSFDLLDAVKDTLEPAFLRRALCLAHGVGSCRPLGEPVFLASYTSSPSDGNETLRPFERTFVELTDRFNPNIPSLATPLPGFPISHAANSIISANRHHRQILDWRYAKFKAYWEPILQNQHPQFLAIGFAAIPTECDDVPPVFPVALSRISDKLAAFVVQSSLWASGLTCFGVEFDERDWGEQGPEAGRMEYIMDKVKDAEEHNIGEEGQRLNDCGNTLNKAFVPDPWKELNPLAFLVDTRAAKAARKPEKRFPQPQAKASTRQACQSMIQSIDRWLHSKEKTFRDLWNCTALAISSTAWAIDRLARQRTTIKQSREDRLRLLGIPPGARPFNVMGETRKEFERINKDSREEWLECKGIVYRLLSSHIHQQYIFSTLETVVGQWEWDWLETWEEMGTREGDGDESGLGEDGGPKGGEDGRPDGGEREHERKPTQGQLHALSDLVIYRAILVVTLLSTAIDNTAILEDESLDRIVPFI